MDEFRAGVTACLRSWSAFRTAVQNEWGGPTSIEKAEALRNEIITAMMIQKRISDIIDLEDALAIYMEEEFSIVLDDNSEKQVANTIFRLYEEATSSNSNPSTSCSPSFTIQIIQMAEKVTKEFGHLPLHIQSSEPMEEDDDDNEENAMNPEEAMEDVNNNDQTTAMVSITTTTTESTIPNVALNMAEYANQPLFGLSREQRRLQILQRHNEQQPVRQLGESIPESQQQASKQDIIVDDDGFVSVPTNRRCKPK